MQAALGRMLVRSGAAFRVIGANLCTALQLFLLGGPGSDPARAAPLLGHATAALARCGAGPLAVSVRNLAQDLSAVARISEAVHGDVYQELLSDLL